MSSVLCQCRHNRFYAHQLVRVGVIVNESGEFVGNLSNDLGSAVYDTERPCGPFQCLNCGMEYDGLEERK